MCALHMHMEQTDSTGSGPITFTAPVSSLLQSSIDSAETVLRILRVVGDEELLGAPPFSSLSSFPTTPCPPTTQPQQKREELTGSPMLEAFLPFQLEDAFASAFILHLMQAISPMLVRGHTWRDDIDCVLDKMISKGSIVAPLRKAELRQLELNMRAFAPPRRGSSGPSAEGLMIMDAGVFSGGAAGAGGGGGAEAGMAAAAAAAASIPVTAAAAAAAAAHEAFPAASTPPPMTVADMGWDLFMEHGAVGIPPDEMLDLAAQLEVDHDYVSHVGW
jgi:hypothetical protein